MLHWSELRRGDMNGCDAPVSSADGNAAVAYIRVGIASLVVLALTSVHHVYGAIVYETPWRLHITPIAIPIGLMIVAGLVFGYAHRGRKRGRVGTWFAAAVTIIFPVSIIGLYEGGYNHILKNLLYFSGAANLVDRLFPAPTYELPNDIWFEASGIAQFFAALVAATTVWRLVRARL